MKRERGGEGGRGERVVHTFQRHKHINCIMCVRARPPTHARYTMLHGRPTLPVCLVMSLCPIMLSATLFTCSSLASASSRIGIGCNVIMGNICVRNEFQKRSFQSDHTFTQCNQHSYLIQLSPSSPLYTSNSLLKPIPRSISYPFTT